MSANKDFLPSSSPVSSICAIEIIAILFLFVMNCYKSSFQECITIIVLKDDRTTNQPPCCLLKQKKCHSTSLGQAVLGLPSPSPRVCTDGRTDGRTYADVRTKIFRINGLPNFLTHGAPRTPLLISLIQKIYKIADLKIKTSAKISFYTVVNRTKSYNSSRYL